MSSGADASGPFQRRHSTEVLRVPAFGLFWSAATLRSFGGAVSGVAMQVLIVSTLGATAAQIGVLNAIGVLPYLFLGLVVGALMDRWRRQRTLVLATVGQSLVLAAVPVLVLAGALSSWSLAVVLLLQGVLSLFTQSAGQPLLPYLVPRASLVAANARLGQSDTVAATAGPAAAGALLTVIAAPALFALDAVVNAVAAGLQARIAVVEPQPEARAVGRHIGHDIIEGLQYVYRHPTLRPLALSVHIWFLGNSIVTTVFAVFVLRELAVPLWAFGLALTFDGVGGFLGAFAAPRIGARLRAGRAILLGRALAVVPWLLLAVVPLQSGSGVAVLLPMLAAVQFVYGLSMGIEDANDTGYRQSVAPGALQGRMNSTIRTVNRTVFFFGALLTGALATFLGYCTTVGIAAAVFAAAAVVVWASPLRAARIERLNQPPSD